MDENMKKSPQTETGSQTGAFILPSSKKASMHFKRSTINFEEVCKPKLNLVGVFGIWNLVLLLSEKKTIVFTTNSNCKRLIKRRTIFCDIVE